MKKREQGFYWVKEHDKWKIAHWNYGWRGYWFSYTANDKDFDEIDERKIFKTYIYKYKLMEDRTK